jgi:hypothetical protein
MGVAKVANLDELLKLYSSLSSPFQVQEFCDYPVEVGVFCVRRNGKLEIFSMNGKEFPRVVGDGESSVSTLVSRSKYLARFSRLYSSKNIKDRTPTKGELVFLSYVGNHAQGCVFTDLGHLTSQNLRDALELSLGSFTEFSFGRFDLKARSWAALRRGEFKVIELNGVDSLSTSIFDPKNSFFTAYKTLYRQYTTLIQSARSSKRRLMPKKSWYDLIDSVRRGESEAQLQHDSVLHLELR